MQRHFAYLILQLLLPCLCHGFVHPVMQVLSSTFQNVSPSILPANVEDEDEYEQNANKDISSSQEETRKDDMTDRFKYSVNALMGTFDPTGIDDERQDGNILNAMLNFPVKFKFNVVGRTNGDDTIRDEYVAEVKKTILETTGDEDDTSWEITARGAKFVKVQGEVVVQSATMINMIFDDLAALDKTVMRF